MHVGSSSPTRDRTRASCIRSAESYPLDKQGRLFFLLLINLFMAVLGLRFCVRAFSSCGKRGPLFIAVRGPLTVAASLVAEHRLQTRRLSNCGSRAQPLCGMWDLPRPGLELVSPALAGRFSTTAPPGKPRDVFLIGLMADFFSPGSGSHFSASSHVLHLKKFHARDCECSIVESLDFFFSPFI